MPIGFSIFVIKNRKIMPSNHLLVHTIALTLLSGIGSKRARILVQHFNELDELFREKKLNIAKIPGVPSNALTYKVRTEALSAAHIIAEKMDKMGATTVFFTDDDYPKRLKNCEDAPLLLYAKGKVDWNPARTIAIVGTRHATEYGVQLTKELVQSLAPLGVTIVSGMAYGIDVCAHQHALNVGAPTYGVLGHGLDLVYPSEHKRIAKQMLEEGGLITEFFPGLKPDAAHFPMRNRIVAGFSDATVVVESAEKGGSLITAQLAFDYNRDVFAYPGDVHRPYSKGCLKLIQEQKAQLVCSGLDVINAMGWNSEKQSVTQRTMFVELNEIQTKIVEQIQQLPKISLDVLAHKLQLPIGRLSAELMQLELEGVICSLPGNRYST